MKYSSSDPGFFNHLALTTSTQQVINKKIRQ